MRDVFADRIEAGRLLGQEVAARLYTHGFRPLVLGLPRGGVPVAYEVAKAIDADLDVVVARKVGLPGHPELAVGAVSEGGQPVYNHEILGQVRLRPEDLAEHVAAEREEVRRRLRRYRGDRPPVDVSGRVVVLVDDGLATGATARAALRSVREGRPGRLFFAAPVCPPDTARRLAAEADGVICVRYPRDLCAIGYWYADFTQLTDEQVDQYLSQAPAAHR